MRAFLDLLGSQRSIADIETLAPLLAPGELEALRTEGFLQPTGSDRFDEISVPDVIRTVRALWGAGAGGIRTRSIMSHAPMTLGCLELDAEPVDLVLVTGDSYSLEAAAKRRERSIVLVPTDRALTPELRLRHGSRALVAFVVLSEALGAHGGRVCRIDLPAPMPSPLRARTFAPPLAHAPPPPPSALSHALLFEGVTDWGQLTFIKLDNRHILVRLRRRSLTLTAQDLDLVGKRSRQPRKLFEALMAFCENDGCFKGWRFGNAKATKQTLSRLRKKLRQAFGMESDPFYDYQRGVGWIARFKVGDGVDEAERALSPGAREVLARAGKLGRR